MESLVFYRPRDNVIVSHKMIAWFATVARSTFIVDLTFHPSHPTTIITRRYPIVSDVLEKTRNEYPECVSSERTSISGSDDG